jgi:hypothetical protein
MNSVANALLDRLPLLVFTDCLGEAAALGMQQALSRLTICFKRQLSYTLSLGMTGLFSTNLLITTSGSLA